MVVYQHEQVLESSADRGLERADDIRVHDGTRVRTLVLLLRVRVPRRVGLDAVGARRGPRAGEYLRRVGGDRWQAADALDARVETAVNE